jgi:hypothetical protein
MKEQPSSNERSMHHDTDRRGLVNLDLYNNEITTMLHKLHEVGRAHSDSEVKKKAQHLKHRLDNKKLHLEEFQKNFDVEQMESSPKQKSVEDIHKRKGTHAKKNDENFFQHLQAFESEFKDIREEVLEFLDKQE